MVNPLSVISSGNVYVMCKVKVNVPQSNGKVVVFENGVFVSCQMLKLYEFFQVNCGDHSRGSSY